MTTILHQLLPDQTLSQKLVCRGLLRRCSQEKAGREWRCWKGKEVGQGTIWGKVLNQPALPGSSKVWAAPECSIQTLCCMSALLISVTPWCGVEARDLYAHGTPSEGHSNRLVASNHTKAGKHTQRTGRRGLRSFGWVPTVSTTSLYYIWIKPGYASKYQGICNMSLSE